VSRNVDNEHRDPKPIIGMLNGATACIGLVHALYCDLRFAADNTVFTTAFSRRGSPSTASAGCCRASSATPKRSIS
jgi:enoyl-CoA hydratase/carnithine racemase